MRNSIMIKERISMFKKYLCKKYFEQGKGDDYDELTLEERIIEHVKYLCRKCRPSYFSNREANQYAVAAMLEKLPDRLLIIFTIIFAWKFIDDGWSTKYIRDNMRRRMEEYQKTLE